MCLCVCVYAGGVCDRVRVCRVFVLAADETERSWNAYLSTLFMLRPKDRLIVVHIYDEAGK